MANEKEVHGRGTDTMEIIENDPHAARKAIIAKHNDLAQAELDMDMEEHGGIREQTRQMEDQLANGFEEVRNTDKSDDTAPDLEDVEGDGSVTEAQDVSAENEGENVIVRVLGEDVSVPKAQVDADGGVANTQRRLGSEARFREAANLSRVAEEATRQANERLADVERRERELIQKTAGRAEAGAQSLPTGATVDPQAVDRIVDDLYSGDPERAKLAVSEVLKARGLSPDEVRELTEVELGKSEAKRLREDAEEANRRRSVLVQAERTDVNNLMRERYGVILQNPVLLRGTLALFDEATKDPKNAGRSWVSIADEVGASVLQQIGAPREDVPAEISARKSFKRRLPSPSEATGRSPMAEPEPRYPTRPSDVVAMMRHARGQSPMT